MAAKQFGNRNQNPLRLFTEALDRALADLPGMVVAHGECEFLRSEAVGAFREAWLKKYPDGDLALLRGAGEARPASLSDITAEMAGGSLFAKDKLVEVRQAERILFPSSRGGDTDDDAPAAGGDREKGFLRVLESPPARTWLFLESAQLPRNRTLGKRLAADCFLIPCSSPTPRDVPEWLDGRAAKLGKILDPEAAELLLRAHGTDLGVLARELDKLALFAGDGRRVDAAMVGEFLTGSIEFDFFGFTNAVEARDLHKALFYARRITLQGTRDQRGKKEDGVKSAHRVVNMLGGTMKGLLRARVALAEGRDSGEFAAAEKLSPGRAGKLLEAAGRFQMRELRLMVGEAAEQLRRAHDTGGDALLALEIMAVKFAGGPDGRAKKRRG